MLQTGVGIGRRSILNINDDVLLNDDDDDDNESLVSRGHFIELMNPMICETSTYLSGLQK